MPIFCQIGLHKWKKSHVEIYGKIIACYYICKKCPKRKIDYTNMEDVAKKVRVYD